MTRRLSPQARAVLQALAHEPDRDRHGYELGQEVGLKAGSLYPILIRLADRGLVAANWETDPPAGRPRRHLYRITGAGQQALDVTTGHRTVPGSNPAIADRSMIVDRSRAVDRSGVWA